MSCLKAGLPLLRNQQLQSTGARDREKRARRKRQSVEDANMEDADIELVKKVRATSLSHATCMPWFSDTQHQWDEDLKITADNLRKSARAQETASTADEPRLPAPRADDSSVSSSSSSSSSSSAIAPAHKGHHPLAAPLVPALPGEKECRWAIHAGREKLYLGQHQLVTNLLP